MNNGIVIFSSDNMFVSFVCVHLLDEYSNAILERVMDTEELIIMLEAFTKEGINKIRIVFDTKLTFNEYSEIVEIMESYSSQFDYEISRGLDTYVPFQKV